MRLIVVLYMRGHIASIVLLTSLPRGDWTTVTFSVPAHMLEVLRGDIPDVRLRLRVNSSSCNAPVIIDNVRFTGDTEVRTVYHTTGSDDIVVSSSGVLAFDNNLDWSASVSSWSDTEILTQGTASLAFEPTNWTLFESVQFSTTELEQVTSLLNLDVYIPELPPDPYWVGAVQVYVECPSAGIYNYYIGQSSLDYLFDGEFNATGYRSLQFDVPEAVKTVLKGSYDDCRFRIAISVNPSWGTFRLDNGGFVQ